MVTDKYPAFPKIPRLHREITITEKIDGTNGLIEIVNSETLGEQVDTFGRIYTSVDGVGGFFVRAGSRNRWLAPQKGSDNFGFSGWVRDNARELATVLGAGLHYGEWWGQGIQRGYGLTEKRFSLFNVSRWRDAYDNGSFAQVPELHLVPVITNGNALDLNLLVDDCTHELRTFGSYAVEGFMNPEGIVVYHKAGNHLYKVTLEGDEAPKGQNR